MGMYTKWTGSEDKLASCAQWEMRSLSDGQYLLKYVYILDGVSFIQAMLTSNDAAHLQSSAVNLTTLGCDNSTVLCSGENPGGPLITDTV